MMAKKKEKDCKREIPASVKREVRQRCGFCCVRCGFPIFEYHHIEYWSKTQTHKASEITCLCPDHHEMVHKNLLKIQQVKRDNENPCQIRNGPSKNIFNFEGDSCKFSIGGCTFIPDHPMKDDDLLIPLVVDNIPIVFFRKYGQQYLLGINLFDEENNKCLEILNNEFVSSIGAWDMTIDGNTLTLRSAPRKILLEMKVNPPDEIVISKARIFLNGIDITIENGLTVNNANHSFSNGTIGGTLGIGVGDIPEVVPFGIKILEIDRIPCNNPIGVDPDLINKWVTSDISKNPQQ